MNIREFLLEHGWRCERMHAYDTPAWIEKPSLGIGRLKMLMTKDVFPLDTEKDRVIEERKKQNRKFWLRFRKGNEMPLQS